MHQTISGWSRPAFPLNVAGTHTLEPAVDQPRSATPTPGGSRSRTIGVLSFDPASHGEASALSGIQRAAHGEDYSVSIISVPVLTRTSLLIAVERLSRLAVEGILVVAPERATINALAEISGDIPLVAVAAAPQEALSVVAVDDYSGAVAATRHLLELDHRTVYHVAGPAHRQDADRRLAGWRDTLLAAGADVPRPLVGDWSPDLGYELGCRLGASTNVTAVFVANDQMAVGVLRALFEAGRRVPQEVSVVGFDGIPEGEFFTPPLTTVQPDYAEIGRRSLQLLQSEIEAGAGAKIHETIPAELILRASTAVAA
jgi:DNA-binding LacI/PurR family transcriptional regulator